MHNASWLGKFWTKLWDMHAESTLRSLAWPHNITSNKVTETKVRKSWVDPAHSKSGEVDLLLFRNRHILLSRVARIKFTWIVRIDLRFGRSVPSWEIPNLFCNTAVHHLITTTHEFPTYLHLRTCCLKEPQNGETRTKWRPTMETLLPNPKSNGVVYNIHY